MENSDEKYKWNFNFIRDYLLSFMINGIDISDKDYLTDFHVEIGNMISMILQTPSDIKYLDFTIKESNGYTKVIPHNSITALWFIGVFPFDINDVLTTNRFILEEEGEEYIYDEDVKNIIIRKLR